MDINQKITEELGVKKWQVDAAVKLIDEGNTIPFIARYRKEAHGTLDDEQLRKLYERLTYLRNLEEKKEQVLASIEEQGKLTPELKAQIVAAETQVLVDDLYRPYRPKRRTRATIAKEKGLEPLAVLISLQNSKEPLEKEAEKYIFGYSIFNDISSRGLQKEHIQWYRGKSIDTYSTMGPVILHKSLVPHPLELKICSEVNDEIRQNSNTKYMLSNVSKIISEISNGITLEPGDIIITGTPDGVGLGYNPPKFLKKEDIVKCKIEKIGELINKVE